MARKVQSQSSRTPAGAGSFLGLLANALFWFVVAIVVPIKAIAGAFPEFAPYAHWAPVLFYGLALWSLIRALRVLQRVVGNGIALRARLQPSGAPQADRPSQARKSKTDARLAIARPPTVQRMR